MMISFARYYEASQVSWLELPANYLTSSSFKRTTFHHAQVAWDRINKVCSQWKERGLSFFTIVLPKDVFFCKQGNLERRCVKANTGKLPVRLLLK